MLVGICVYELRCSVLFGFALFLFVFLIFPLLIFIDTVLQIDCFDAVRCLMLNLNK